MKELFEKLAADQTPNTFPRRTVEIPLPVEAHHLSDDQRDTLTTILITIVNTVLGLVFRRK